MNLEHLARRERASRLQLGDHARVAVVGGGPAGSLCACFLVDFARRIGRTLHIDIYETKDFSVCGPKGCNHCGGIISESLVQHLAAEGIVLPESIIQRGIDAYVLHTEAGSVDLRTPLQEKRIAATYRGGGPRGAAAHGSFDGFLLELARARGAVIVPARVDAVTFVADRPLVTTADGSHGPYDLLVGATGVNSAPAGLFDHVHAGFEPAQTSRTFISEFHVGRERLGSLLGDAMHVFLLDIPRLQFAAIIPKGDYATLVLLGDGIDQQLLQRFLASPEVRRCFPPGEDIADLFACRCFPKINVRPAARPWADRVVLVGDVAVTKLYKNGIGAAYLAAKAAASAAVFGGVSAEAFAIGYGPVCRKLSRDNGLGRLIFAITGLVKKLGPVKRGFLRVIAREQSRPGSRRRLSLVMWDTFTGSAPYAGILRRMVHPALVAELLKETTMSIFDRSDRTATLSHAGGKHTLGRIFADGEAIVRQGEAGECMFVVQEGQVEVVNETTGREVPLAVLGPGEFFGEMALFERALRSSTVRARGPATVLTIDRHTLLAQITANPSLAFTLIEGMSGRIRALTLRHARVMATDRRDWETRPATAAVAARRPED